MGPVKLSPRFSLDIDFAREQTVADISSNKIDTAEKIPFTPFVFPVPKPKNLPPSDVIPALSDIPVKAQPAQTPQPAVPSPQPAVPGVPVPQTAVPVPQPAVPVQQPAPTPSQPALPPSRPALPRPQPAVPRPQPAIPPTAVPPLPQAVPAVPGRPILSAASSSPSENGGKTFVPMPVPAVPGL